MGSALDRVIRFGQYTLHPVQGLTCGTREIRLTRKALSLLCLLVDHGGRLVTKEHIFTTVWPDVTVSDSALTSCIRELRRALKDDARAPRFIETRHRTGFRFLPPTAADSDPDSAAAGVGPAEAGHYVRPENPSLSVRCVGRRESLDILAASLARAHAGARQLVVVQGEPGIGKTTLVDAFLEEVRETPSTIVTGGLCVEEVGAGEPYRPILDAVSRLCRGAHGPHHATLLRQYAPTWLAQLPALQTPAERKLSSRRNAGVTRERMSRELTDFVEALASGQTLVVSIDDLQLADDSTLDWLASFAARPDAARVMVIVTLRTERVTRAHALCAGLGIKTWCRQISLSGLDETATRELVARHWPSGDATVTDLVRRVHRLTEGHPLFVLALVDELLADEAVPDRSEVIERELDGHREGLTLPARLRAFIDEQISRLDAGETALLEVASLVADPEWSSALVAAGSDREPQEVEAILMRLAQRQAFIHHVGPAAWPDGTIAERFAFRHGIHREVLRARMPAGRRADVHGRVGSRLERAFAACPAHVALPLALHFERSGDAARALHYLAEAAAAANRMGAAEEAGRHITRALALLRTLPQSAERDQRELELQMLLGSTLMTGRGWGASEVESAYQRASELCDRLESTPQRFPAYWGLWLFRWGRGELPAAHDLAGRLEILGEQSSDPMLHLQVHHAHWATAFCQGRFDDALERASLGSALCRDGLAAHTTLHYGNHDAGVCASAFAARAHAVAGRAAAARRAAEEAVSGARRLDHPFSLVLALVFAAATHQLLGDTEAVADCAREAEAISGRHGFRLMSAWARALNGWALSQSGTREHAVRIVREAVSSALATGSGQFRTYFLTLLAETHHRAGQRQEGLAVLDEASECVRQVGERFHEAELHRLRGELLALDPSPASLGQAANAFTRSVAVARAQGAHLFLLRTTSAQARYL